ncbi:MAG: hypothetical protein K2I75_08415 [Clostridiales bacterium]|nr:hypothetical protein [Clostridiales bacterium]
MENLFKFSVQTEEAVYDKYVVRSVSDDISAKQDNTYDELKKFEKASKIPRWLKIIQILCALTAGCTLLGVLRAFGENIGKESFASMWNRFVGNGVIIIIVVGVICTAVAIALRVWELKRIKRMESSDEYKTALDECDNMHNGCYEELGVPSDADGIDVLCYPYKLNRKGKEKNGCQFAQYVPINYKIFKQDDGLYFADVNDLIQIPLSAVKEANYVPKRVVFYGWTKDDKFNSEKYKPYKIRANNYGALFMKGYIAVSLLLDGEEKEIIIPLYEQDVIEKYVAVNYTVG